MSAQYIDSLKQQLEVYKDDTTRAQILNRLADHYYQKDAALARIYAEECSVLSEKLGYTSGEADSRFYLTYINYFQAKDSMALVEAEKTIALYEKLGQYNYMADTYYIKGAIQGFTDDPEGAKESYKKCLELSKPIDYFIGITSAYKGLGDLLESEGKYQEALEMYQENLDLAYEHNLTDSQLSGHNDLGRIYDQMGNAEEGLKNYITCLELAQKVNNPRFIAGASQNIASIHFYQKNYPKSIEYADIGLEASKALNDRRGIAGALQTLGNNQYRLGNIDKAQEYYQASLVENEAANNQRGLSFSYHNIARVYAKKEDWPQAVENYQKSLAIRQKIGYKLGITESQAALGQIKMKQGKPLEALPLFENGLEISRSIGAKYKIRDRLADLAKCMEQLGRYQQAYAYQKELKVFQDSLFNEDQNKKIAEMQTQYDTEQKEKQLLAQENDILRLDADKSRLEKQRNYTLGGALFLGLLGFFGYRINSVIKDRNDKKAFAEALIYAQEEERKRIAQDLHDGVGQSLLLLKKQLQVTHTITMDNTRTISDTLEEVRTISRDLHPFQLEKLGLVAALESQIKRVADSTGLFISKELDPVNQLLSPQAEIQVFRTIQEALNNVVKHAEASAAQVHMKIEGKEILVTIRDNGKGFDSEVAIAKMKSLGLKTMNERIQSLGGQFKIEKNEPQGSVIRIRLPQQNQA
ncbi:MAG: hypothetical protein Sapg2KO_37510 [Saprospiraceae bacterium]